MLIAFPCFFVCLFSEQEYEKAIALYTKAIELNPTVAVYYGNRSIAYLRTEYFGCALTDASKAIELDKNYVKGYYRRAAAYMSLGKFKLALADFKTVMKAKPTDKVVKDRCMECCKMVKMLAFQEAISVEEKKNIADMINLEAMGKYGVACGSGIKSKLHFKCIRWIYRHLSKSL